MNQVPAIGKKKYKIKDYYKYKISRYRKIDGDI
jgi:hypothetical protein